MSENKVKWHPYPEEKPPKENVRYLVTAGIDGHIHILVQHYVQFKERCGFFVVGDDCVIAWAELPEPYKEEF